MKISLASLWLLTGMAYAQEGFSPTLPWGTGSRSVQAGDIHNGFSPTMPYVKVSGQQVPHDNPHQDPRSCSSNRYRPYGYYNNYYYRPGSGYDYNNGYGQGSSPSPLPSTPPPGY